LLIFREAHSTPMPRPSGLQSPLMLTPWNSSALATRIFDGNAAAGQHRHGRNDSLPEREKF